MEEFERLSVPERIKLRRLLAARLPMTEDLTEDDFATIAAETFSILDAEPWLNAGRSGWSTLG
jgi:hypothetical protein